IEMVLPAWLEGRRWFRGHTREISHTRILDVVPFDSLRLTLIAVEFSQGEDEQYVLPLAIETGETPASPQAVIAIGRRPGGAQGSRVDAPPAPASAAALLETIRTGTRSCGASSMLVGSARPGMPQGEARLYRQEHHAASVQYGDALLLKFFRRLGEGM